MDVYIFDGLICTDVIIDFGDIDPDGKIAGLIGLDILRESKAVIDVEIPMVYTK